MIKFFILSFFSVAGWQAYAQTDPCSTLADLASKTDSNSFVGFGAGSTQKQADENAQVDLASRIRQNITATSTVTQDNNSSHLQSSAKSLVSESLIGAKVIKRCANKDSFSTTISLSKSLFVDSLEKKLSANATVAKSFINSLNTKQSEETLAKNVDQAKKFLKDHQNTFENDLQLCHIYNGCAAIKTENAFHALSLEITKLGDKNQYLMLVSNNKITDSFRDELVSLAEAEGIQVIDSIVADENNPQVSRKIFGKCDAKVGSPVPGSTDKVVNIQCTLEGYTGKQKTFRKVYGCKTLMDSSTSREEAINSCSGRLQLTP